MKWIDIYKSALKIGSSYDIRNNEKIINKNEISNLDVFDYADSLIINGNYDKEINNLYVAIDVDTSELILVKELIKNGFAIDGVLSHHPIGKGCYLIHEVIDIQRYNWIKFGVNKKIANKLHFNLVWEEKIESGGNHISAQNCAKYLDIPLMCIHTPIDNIVQKFFEDLFIHKNEITLNEAMDIVNNIPECKMASDNGDKPFLVSNNKEETVNNKKNNLKLGRFLIDMTGGVDPPDEIFYYLKKAGIDTIVGMHYNLDNIKSIIKNELNAIICGHMACDSIGVNIFCDYLENNGVNIISGAGFYRFKRY